MSRPLAGYIGYDGEPTTEAAPGIWTLREAELYQRKAQWPLPFAPSDITGLQAWYDASDASTLYDATTGGSLVAADGSVARWEDKSGNDRHATQSTAGSRPARKTAIQGGLDVLRFDGSDDGLLANGVSSVFSGEDTPFTLFMVADSNESNSNNVAWSSGTSNSLDGYIAGYLRSYISFFMRSDGGVSGTFTTTLTNPAGFVAATWKSTGTSQTVYADGVAGFTNNDDLGAITPDRFSIGYNQRDSAGAYLTGDICEIIIYNSALSDTDREAVENYLIEKWGIT